MSRKATLSEEERRRRRNEASRRCYLKRKAGLAGQAQPVGAKNKKPKAKAVEAKPAKPVRAKPTRRGPDPVVAAERLCKTYARVAGGIKPMMKDAAEFLGIVYKSEDQRVAEKVERILAKGLGVSVSRLASDPMEKTRVCLDAVSKAVKTPKFRLTADAAEPAEPEPLPEDPAEDEPAEVPVDPSLLEKVDAGEADKSEIEIPQIKDDKSDEDEDEDDLDDEDENDLDDDDDDDDDDESEEAQERRARRREREESDNVRDWESGRWEMMGEMGEMGAFDD